MKPLIYTILFSIYTLLSCTKEEPFKWTLDYDISIMSFNLRYDEPADGKNQWSNRREACIKLLNESNPSIFGIQEGLYNQVNYLDENLPQYDYVGVGRDDGYSSGEYAAIFYDNERFEVIETGNFWLSETPEAPSLGWDANNIRIVTWVQLKDHLKNGKQVYAFNTHFDHKGKIARKESAKLLMRKISEITNEDATIFITGDFNALIRASMFDPIIDEFYSARRFANNSDNIKSFNAFGRWYLNRNIDFIFYNNANALSFRTIAEDFGVSYISDHYPLIAHFNY